MFVQELFKNLNLNSMQKSRNEFKESFIKGSTAGAISDMAQTRKECSKYLKVPVALVTSTGGGYLVCNENGRLDAFPNKHNAKRDYPVIKEVKELFEEVRSKVDGNFNIQWDVHICYYEKYQHRFERLDTEPTDDYSVTFLLYYESKNK